MHTEPLCPYCGKADFAIKEQINLPHSTIKPSFIFCTSCGKIIGQPVPDYEMVLETISGQSS
jgi:hypothetical protein